MVFSKDDDAMSTARELGQLRVDALRSACLKRGLPAGGRKDQLMARLIEADKARMRKQKNAAQSASNGQKGLHGKSPGRGSSTRAATPRSPSGLPRAAVAPRSPGGVRAVLPMPRSPGGVLAAASSARVAAPNGRIATHTVRAGLPSVPVTMPRGQAGLAGANDRSRSPCGRFMAPSTPQLMAPGTPRLMAPGTPRQLGQRAPHIPQSPQAMPRRRLREKSPDPHRYRRDCNDELGFMRSPGPARQHDLSPSRAPRRRIREKSPDPHRHAVDWQRELGFMGSPVRPHEAGNRGKYTIGDKSPGTPGKRLRAKTPEWQVLLEQQPPAKVQRAEPITDPSEALMLLSRRELLEMCEECGITMIWHLTKVALIERLVEAHLVGRDASPLLEAAALPERLDAASSSHDAAPDAASSSQVAAPAAVPAMRFVPPPPSSWTAPPLPSSWTALEVSELVEIAEPTQVAETTKESETMEVFEVASHSEVGLPAKAPEFECTSLLASTSEAQISSSPTPARSPPRITSPKQLVIEASLLDAPAVDVSSAVASFVALGEVPPPSPETSKESSGSTKNDWWKNVALRWPKIVANLKAGTPVQEDAAAAHSPQASHSVLGKRLVGSPSILDC